MPEKISANSTLIQRAFMNIIENAIKYSNEGSEVLVKSISGNNAITVNIKDFGEGIPSSQIDKIFDRFYRIDKSRSRNSGGSGLGLSIAKRIFELHNATISIQSKQGKGTEVTIVFPIS